MAEYRYLFADLLTNQVLAELPLTNVTFGQELNTAGPFQGELLLSGVNTVTDNLLAATIPSRTAIYVDRDGTIVWAGMLWTRSYYGGSEGTTPQKVVFGGKEFESYFEHRLINFDYNLTQTATDQLKVVQDLMNTVQTATNGNIGVQIGTETSGVTVYKYYNSYDLKPVTEAIYELSQSATGFDWNIDVAYDSSYNIVKTLKLEYPRRGKVWNATRTDIPMIEFPGNVIRYTYPEDGTGTVNSMYGLGAGSGYARLTSNQQATAQLTAGWPLLEKTVTYTDYTDSTLLGNLTLAQMQAVQNPPVVMTADIPTYVDPLLGSYGTGDDFRIRITDDRFPAGVDIVRRLSKYDVTVGDNGPEYVTLNLVATTN